MLCSEDADPQSDPVDWSSRQAYHGHRELDPFVRHTASWQMAGLGSHPVQTLLAAFLTAHQPAQRGTRPDWEPGNASLQSGSAKKKRESDQIKHVCEIYGVLLFLLNPTNLLQDVKMSS